jgi:hypothetical protein
LGQIWNGLKTRNPIVIEKQENNPPLLTWREPKEPWQSAVMADPVRG